MLPSSCRARPVYTHCGHFFMNLACNFCNFSTTDLPDKMDENDNPDELEDDQQEETQSEGKCFFACSLYMSQIFCSPNVWFDLDKNGRIFTSKQNPID